MLFSFILWQLTGTKLTVATREFLSSSTFSKSARIMAFKASLFVIFLLTKKTTHNENASWVRVGDGGTHSTVPCRQIRHNIILWLTISTHSETPTTMEFLTKGLKCTNTKKTYYEESVKTDLNRFSLKFILSQNGITNLSSMKSFWNILYIPIMVITSR